MGAVHDEPDIIASELDDALMLDTPIDERPSRRPLFAGLAVATVLGWVAGALYLARESLTSIDAVTLVQFLAAVCVVPALVGIVWLLALRTSRAEAHRFGTTAQAMRAEAASLERTVAILTDRIESNRAQLAEQITTMMAMGDHVAERFGSIGHDMTIEIAQADAHARTLSGVVTDAHTSLGALLAALPRAQAETDALAARLDATGLSASEHAAALDAQIVALAERGREADAMASGAAQRLAAHIVRMETTSETAGARLEAVTDGMSSAVDALLDRTADAVDEARKGIAVQGDAMIAMIRANQAALDTAARDSATALTAQADAMRAVVGDHQAALDAASRASAAALADQGETMLAMVSANQATLDGAARDSADALAARIATVEDAIERVAMRLDLQRTSGDIIVDNLNAGLGAVEARIDMLHQQGTERTQMVAASISALGGSADAMTDALRAGEAMARQTIGTTETLLVALDAAAREIDETLPEALVRLDSRVLQSKGIVVSAKPELLALVTAAESTHDAIEAIAGVIGDQRRVLDHLSGTLIETLNAGRAKADALGQMVDETIDRTNRFSEEAAPRLVEALLRVRETATVAADKARETLSEVIPAAANALETASADAMRRATSDTVDRQVRAIAESADAAVAAATRATERLADRVREIVEQTAIVETRMEEARGERDEAERNTFARRVSQLIETLNSASIDITKTFAPEVSDSAWSAYLKGDRGVFTRRAVRILDAGEAREVAALYDDDSGFRETVNRYIHDFEAMLRTILAQRDGSPLGVTMLSSDMGKLYVALAQAIERLR